MTTLQTLTIAIAFGLLSCDNNRTAYTVKSDKDMTDSVSIDTSIKSGKQSVVGVSDTIKRFVVDDYPISNAMLAAMSARNSSYKIQSGLIYSYDKVWFSNDTLKQTLVFELYTDYHRMVSYHFYNKDIPFDLINRMELHIDEDEIASEKQKQKDFNGILKQTTKVNSTYFVSKNGFRLGDAKQKIIDKYGNPDKSSVSHGIERLEWSFIGDELYDSKTDLKGKPLAKDSYGHQILMYFKNGKLIGQILYNDIP